MFADSVRASVMVQNLIGKKLMKMREHLENLRVPCLQLEEVCAAAQILLPHVPNHQGLLRRYGLEVNQHRQQGIHCEISGIQSKYCWLI